QRQRKLRSYPQEVQDANQGDQAAKKLVLSEFLTPTIQPLEHLTIRGSAAQGRPRIVSIGRRTARRKLDDHGLFGEAISSDLRSRVPFNWLRMSLVRTKKGRGALRPRRITLLHVAAR